MVTRSLVFFAAGRGYCCPGHHPLVPAGIHPRLYRTASPHTLTVINGTACPSGQTALSWNQRARPVLRVLATDSEPNGPEGSIPGRQRSEDVAPGATGVRHRYLPVISGTTGYATGGGVVTYNNGADPE